jgi:hypothetical protein
MVPYDETGITRGSVFRNSSGMRAQTGLFIFLISGARPCIIQPRVGNFPFALKTFSIKMAHSYNILF